MDNSNLNWKFQKRKNAITLSLFWKPKHAASKKDANLPPSKPRDSPCLTTLDKSQAPSKQTTVLAAPAGTLQGKSLVKHKKKRKKSPAQIRRDFERLQAWKLRKAQPQATSVDSDPQTVVTLETTEARETVKAAACVSDLETVLYARTRVSEESREAAVESTLPPAGNSDTDSDLDSDGDFPDVDSDTDDGQPRCFYCRTPEHDIPGVAT